MSLWEVFVAFRLLLGVLLLAWWIHVPLPGIHLPFPSSSMSGSGVRGVSLGAAEAGAAPAELLPLTLAALAWV